MSELNERLARLKPLQKKSRAEFDGDAYLRDIVERNLEVAAQCCIDICHRLIAQAHARRPADYYEAFIILGEMGVYPSEFARQLAPLAGFRNILTHEYLGIDWDHVYHNLRNLGDLEMFSQYILHWLKH